nr:hypothetical protein CFP56_31866 [Quercus suber]
MYVNGTRPFQGNQGHAQNNGGKGGSGFDTPNGLGAQTASQVALVMALALPSSTATSTSSSSSNFSGPCLMEHDWSGLD